MQILRGKTAVVTGAASGIGLALSQLFARQGMNVVMADIETGALSAAKEKVLCADAEVITVECDVSKPAATDALAQVAQNAFGNVHVLCNNAGVFVGGASWESSAADYQWLLDVNVHGIANGLRSFVPAMIAHGEEGHIVNTASMAGFTTMPFSSVYCMTKAAAASLSECLFKEMEAVAPQIGVSLLCPELINTGIAAAARNRPAHYSGAGDVVETEFSKMTHDAITDSTAGGLDPMVMAERVLQGIKDRQFYLLAEDYWKEIADKRLEEIHDKSNPTMFFPESMA